MTSTNIEAKISKDETTAWVSLPGYSYDDTDRTGIFCVRVCKKGHALSTWVFGDYMY